MPEIPFWAPKHRIFVAAQLAATATALVFFATWRFGHWLPSPGVSVAIIAFIAAAMSIHGEMSGYHKAFWMLIIGAFLVLELMAIRHADVEQAERQQHALEEERQHFNDIADGIKAAINQSQDQFKVTMQKTASVLDTTQSVASLARKNLLNVTGGDSFPYVVPQPSAYPGPVGLFIWDHGEYMLNGVTVSIRNDKDFDLFKPSINVGVLHTGWGKPLNTAIQPNPESNDDIWLVEMYTQGGYFTEIVHFRKGHGGKFWAFSFWVNKAIFGPRKEKETRKPKLPVLRPNEGATYTVYDRSKWSDDPQN